MNGYVGQARNLARICTLGAEISTYCTEYGYGAERTRIDESDFCEIVLWRFEMSSLLRTAPEVTRDVCGMSPERVCVQAQSACCDWADKRVSDCARA
eukprot:2020451-Pleurochrysis_carterae.AAC.1